MIYQMIISALNNLESTGNDIGSSKRYCTQNIIDLVQMHEEHKISIQELVKICLDNK